MSQIGPFLFGSGENEKYLKPLPSLCWRCGKSLMWTWFPLRTHFSDLLISNILNLAQPKRHHPPKKGHVSYFGRKTCYRFFSRKNWFQNSFVIFFEFISPPPLGKCPLDSLDPTIFIASWISKDNLQLPNNMRRPQAPSQITLPGRLFNKMRLLGLIWNQAHSVFGKKAKISSEVSRLWLMDFGKNL